MRLRRRPKQSTWIYCPVCKAELISGGNSIGLGMLGFEKFRCAQCGTKSRWDFNAPAPLLIEYARPADARP